MCVRLNLNVVYCVWFVAEAGRAQHRMFDGTTVTVTTNDILHWLTGCKFIPATGLAWKVDVSFDNTRVLPRVSTCGPYVEFLVTRCSTHERACRSLPAGS